MIVGPGFIDLHAHLREPGFEDAETVASGLAAAAHGGFTTVCAMPNTDPAIDEPGVLGRVLPPAGHRARPSSCSPTVLTARPPGRDAGGPGRAERRRRDRLLRRRRPDRSATILRNALLYAGMLGRPVVDHAEDRGLTEGAEAHEGLVATVLGLRGWPAAAESGPVGRDLAILADVLARRAAGPAPPDPPLDGRRARAVRRARADGLPVTCDVTPHHLGLTDAWLRPASRTGPGRSRLAILAGRASGAAPYDPVAPGQSAAPRPEPMRWPAWPPSSTERPMPSRPTTPRTRRSTRRSSSASPPTGSAASRPRSGSSSRRSTPAGCPSAGRSRPSPRGPAGVLAGGGWTGRRGLVEGEPANLVVIDRSDRWTVEPGSLRSKGKNSPLLGRELPGQVLLTVAGGRLAYQAAS